MREIKFRAWDGSNMFFNPEFKGESHTLEDIFQNSAMGFTWMQYTGLKDKNGVEIYEGDVVKDFDEELVGYVSYMREQFYIHANKGHVFYQEDGANFDWNELEVIGNIYQNPSLMN